MSWFRPIAIPVPTVTLRDAIGVFLVSAFIGALGVLFWKAIPKENEQLIVYMLGQLSGFVAGVISYHYVTKAGEKELDAKRADNTAKALDAIKAAQEATPKTDEPQDVNVVNPPSDPANVKNTPVAPPERKKR